MEDSLVAGAADAPMSEPLERGLSAQYGAGASKYLAAEMDEWKQCNVAARQAIRNNVEDALVPLRRAIELRPDWPKGYENLCGALLCCGELTAARREACTVLTEGLERCEGLPGVERLQTKLEEVSKELQERDYNRSLRAAGFALQNLTQEGPMLWLHWDEDIEIMKDGDKINVSATGVAQADVDAFVAQYTQEHPDGAAFGLALLAFVTAERRPTPGVMHTLNHEELASLPKYLREAATELISPAAIGCNASRALTIYTWGKDVIPNERGPVGAEDTQRIFDAKELSARKFGKMGQNQLSNRTGLHPEVQVVFCEYSGTPAWIRDTCACIEREDLTIVSVICAHGQHRSVAAAEIMKMLYYPNANVVHMTMHG